MAETTKSTIEKEYIIPLRKSFLKVPRYKRTSRAVKTIKQYIAKHMKVQNRDVKKVKIDVYFNNELWFRGRKNPPSKVKVKAIKENDIIKVDLVEIPDHIKFLKIKIAKRHKKIEKKPTTPDPKAAAKTETKPDDKKQKKRKKRISKKKRMKKKMKKKKHNQ